MRRWFSDEITVPELTPEEVETARRDPKKRALILDIREPVELVEEGRLEGDDIVNIPKDRV